MKKLTLTFSALLLISSLGTGLAYASSTKKINTGLTLSSHVSLYTTGNSTINCYGHNTDVCIDNLSGERITFIVPDYNHHIWPLPNNDWADDYSHQHYSRPRVIIWNNRHVQIYDKKVHNHGIIIVRPRTAENAKLNVSVMN